MEVPPAGVLPDVAQQGENVLGAEAVAIDLEADQGANVAPKVDPSRPVPSSSGGLANLKHLIIEPLDANTNLEDIQLGISGWEFGFEDSLAGHH